MRTHLTHLRNIFRLILNPPIVQEANTSLRDPSRPDWAERRAVAERRHGRAFRCDKEPQDLQRRRAERIISQKERSTS